MQLHCCMRYDVHRPVEAYPRYSGKAKDSVMFGHVGRCLLPYSWIVDISSDLDTSQEVDKWESKGIPHSIKIDVRDQLHQAIISDQN